MNVISLNGSARGGKGITHRLLHAFGRGLQDTGCDVRMYDLNRLSIEHCTSCFYCMHVRPGICSINDDMTDVYARLQASDLLIIGTPLYTDTMSSRMKVVFDRCISSMQPFVYIDAKGRFRHPHSWRMPKYFILLSTSGFPEPENFSSLVGTVKAQAYNFGSELVASFLIPGSLALQMDLPLLDAHLDMIYKAGVEFGKNNSIPGPLIDRINTPVLSGDDFYKLYLKYEEWCRRKLSG